MLDASALVVGGEGDLLAVFRQKRGVDVDGRVAGQLDGHVADVGGDVDPIPVLVMTGPGGIAVHAAQGKRGRVYTVVAGVIIEGSRLRRVLELVGGGGAGVAPLAEDRQVVV